MVENIYHTNTNQRKAGVAMRMPNKRDFRENKVTREREGHYIIKGSTTKKTQQS